MSEDKMGDFFCIAATTSGRVRIGFEGGAKLAREIARRWNYFEENA